jgi:hypothetical protein
MSITLGQHSWQAGPHMTKTARTTRRQCPSCRVTLTRYQWSRLWFMSSLLSGRLIQPCEECGTELRLSAMTVLAGLGAFGLLTSAVGLAFTPSPWLLIIALLCTLVTLVGVLGTRVERAPQAVDLHAA